MGQRIGNHLVELFNRLVDLGHAMLNDRNTKLEELLGHSAHEIAEACGSIAIERRGHATLAASRASSQVRCNALARCNRAKREIVDERFIELWAVDRSLVVVIERFKHKAHDALLLLRTFACCSSRNVTLLLRSLPRFTVRHSKIEILICNIISFLNFTGPPLR